MEPRATMLRADPCGACTEHSHDVHDSQMVCNDCQDNNAAAMTAALKFYREVDAATAAFRAEMARLGWVM